MTTPTVEQYIKTIYQLSSRSGEQQIQMTPLAEAMKVTPGTATSMAKHLAERGFVSYVPRHGVALTSTGQALALRMIRRHRLIETFLEQVLGYDWSEVHADAEVLEHAVSDLFVERINALLGNPDSDPHGDPIPALDGSITATASVPLSEVAPGTAVEIIRLMEGTPSFLEAMNDHAIRPGNSFRVVERNEVLDTVAIQRDDGSEPVTIAAGVVANVLVRILGSS